MSVIEFWKHHLTDLDLKKLNREAISVKGTTFHNPCRSLEIYGNVDFSDADHNHEMLLDRLGIRLNSSSIILDSGIEVPLKEGIYHPPFVWQDCSPEILATNFTYITTSFYRILKGLTDQELIPTNQIENLLDKACLILSNIYKARDSYIMKNINNNLNMFLIFKIVENIAGKKVYDSNNQEPIITDKTLDYTLNSIDAFTSFSVKQLMAISLGRGIAYTEKFLGFQNIISSTNKYLVEKKTHSYIDRKLTIDDRDHLISRVHCANDEGKKLSMCVILDDTSETVFDLLWMQKLLEANKFFKINLLVNTAQISINFSSSMLKKIFDNNHFKILASKLNTQLFIYETYCPFMSFQVNLLQSPAQKVIEESDFIYIKGLNFFETCQFKNKDTYYAFVVYGSVSCKYTGLKDNDSVFAFVPEGKTGYIHDKDSLKILTLHRICSPSCTAGIFERKE